MHVPAYTGLKGPARLHVSEQTKRLLLELLWAPNALPLLLLLIAVGFSGLAVLDVQYDTALRIRVAPTPNYWAFLPAAVFLSVALVVYWSSGTLGWVPRGAISRLDGGGYAIVVKERTTIRVVFGRIDDPSMTDRAEVVVLPTTELFDDQCVLDQRSSLGAFAAAHFSDPPALLERARSMLGPPERPDGSYGIGRCVYLEEPLGTKQRMFLVSVTSAREGRTRAEVEYLYRAIGVARAEMAQRRISKCILPVLGAGHGGLPREVALFHLVAALAHGASDTGGPHLGEATIVVYRASKDSAPELTSKVVRRVLSTVSGLLSAA